MARNLKTGAVIGNYRILSEIGLGGLGQVFKAVHLQKQTIVALKVINERLYLNKKFIGHFHREIINHSELRHKNIVRLYESCFKPPLCYIASEYVDGWSGRQFIKRNHRRIPPLVALSIVGQILQGLDYLHLRDMVHSDLSVGNFLVERTGRVVLADFGLSSSKNDHKNYLVGTPGYYSPEHIDNSGITHCSDTYCVGLLLHEMITGRQAVVASKDRKKVMEGMRNITLNISCSDRVMRDLLVQILSRALQFSSARRYPSAERMLYDCGFVLNRFKVRRPRQVVLTFLDQVGMIDSPEDSQQHSGSAIQTITQDGKIKAS